MDITTKKEDSRLKKEINKGNTTFIQKPNHSDGQHLVSQTHIEKEQNRKLYIT